MTRYLLDTNIALDIAQSPEALSSAVREALEQGNLFLSVISYWEVVIKSAKGNLSVGDPRRWWRLTLDKIEALGVPFLPEHVSAVADLPPIHQDPFDRALIAQATVEGLVLITSDRVMPQYGNERLKILT